jgi:hypothetical protein
MGIAMTTYFGGRTEARIRLVPIPCIHCDFLSMYPSVVADALSSDDEDRAIALMKRYCGMRRRLEVTR